MRHTGEETVAETDATFKTLTMAQVYAGQGKWAQTVAICRHLLRQNSGDREAARLLALADGQIDASRADRLLPLVRQWAGLIWRLNLLRKLARGRGHFR